MAEQNAPAAVAKNPRVAHGKYENFYEPDSALSLRRRPRPTATEPWVLPFGKLRRGSMCCVYALRAPPKVVYVGLTCDLLRRVGDHFRQLRALRHSSDELQAHFNAGGDIDVFALEDVVGLGDGERIARESAWAKMLASRGFEIVSNHVYGRSV